MKEEVTEVLNKVMFVFCLTGRSSLVFIDERHQLELNFQFKFRSDRAVE